MKNTLIKIVVASLLFSVAACKETGPPVQKAEDEGLIPATTEKKDQPNMKIEAEKFLSEYNADFARLEKPYNLAYWTAANSGKKEDWNTLAAAELEFKKMHSDKERYEKIILLRKSEADYDAITARSLEVAELAFKENQLPTPILQKMIDASKEIELLFNAFRPEIDGKKMTNNEIIDTLAAKTKSSVRQKYWEGLKQIGSVVGPKLVELAKIRNAAAKQLGFKNYWEMKIITQEYNPAELIAMFDHLETLTEGPFKKMKANLDAELSTRFGIKPEEMKPWHYDNPFFQTAPPSKLVNLDDFYKDKPKEEIMAITQKFYTDIGLPCDDIIKKSDLYEREGKDQHAFCIDIDRQGDVRTLLNIKPTARWMETSLHEEGHAVYSKGIDPNLPHNIRDSAHIFTTEGIAMLFGALGKNPKWMVEYANCDQAKVNAAKDAILEQRRREQLIFARWAMVMFNFERLMYENPEQDLNKLWWDTVERLQMVPRPVDRNMPDWAAKPHFTIAPVYYHNYLLGEVFAAQLRATLAKKAGHKGPTSSLSFNGRKDFGEFLDRKIFKPGMTEKWPKFVENATGQPLSPEFYAQEIE